jgi:hypothetical protein
MTSGSTSATTVHIDFVSNFGLSAQSIPDNVALVGEAADSDSGPPG